MRGDPDILGHRVEAHRLSFQMVAGLVQPHEALDERESRTQGVGVQGVDVSRQRDGLAGLDGLRGCEPGFIGDQVEGAEPVVLSPSA